MTEVVVIIGLIVIGIMVPRGQAAQAICTRWLIKPLTGMPSYTLSTTIDRAPISLDPSRR